MKRFAIIFGALVSLLLVALLILYGSPPSKDRAITTEPAWKIAFTQPNNDGKADLDQEFCQWLSQTQKSVDLAAFDIDLPCVSEALLTLHKAHKNVRIVTDSDNITPEIEVLKQSGIVVVDDQRGAFMHNKFIVQDGQEVWTGSMNLTNNGVYRNNNNVVRLRDSGIARLYTAEFEELFRGEFGPRSPRQNLPALFQLDDLEVEVFFSPEDPVQERILDLLKSARQSIYFMAFSFTDDAIGKLVQNKAEEGLEVHGIFEKTGSKSKYSEYGRLKAKKIDVVTDGNPGIMHHKVFILDQKTVITGSYNFSKNANKSNDENLLVLHNPQIAQLYLNEFKYIHATASK